LGTSLLVYPSSVYQPCDHRFATILTTFFPRPWNKAAQFLDFRIGNLNMPTSMETRSTSRCCQAALIDINLRWLHQALALLAKIDENVYATAPPALSSYRVGAHARHILDFYQCFFKGLEGGRIDYDVRGRNRVVE